MERNKKARAKNKAKQLYLLSGLVRCGGCGSAMSGGSGKSRDKDYFYYRCYTKHNKRSCEQGRIKKEHLESLVLHQLRLILAEDRSELIAKIRKVLNEKFNTFASEVKIFKKILGNVEKE